MSEKSSTEIQKQLEDIAKGKHTGKELLFDPKTGDLVVKPENEKNSNPDSTIVDQIAEDGFFKS